MNPQILYNPKSSIVEFMYDHQVYSIKPGEKKLFDGEVADHALKYVNTGLQIYDGTIATGTSAVAYSEMPWREVISLASKRGIFKPGMKREEVFKLMEEADAKGS